MKKNIRTIVVVVICAALIVGYYYYLSTRDTGGAQNKGDEETEVEQVIGLPIEVDYPSTPREVVKVFNRILQCYYNEEYTDKQLVKLANKQRELLDEELLENNPDTQYIQNIRADIKNCKEEKRTISSISMCGTNEVIYKVVDGRDCAYVTCSYFMKVGKEYETTYQRYVLRRDDDGNWKILVYYVIEGE